MPKLIYFPTPPSVDLQRSLMLSGYYYLAFVVAAVSVPLMFIVITIKPCGLFRSLKGVRRARDFVLKMEIEFDEYLSRVGQNACTIKLLLYGTVFCCLLCNELLYLSFDIRQWALFLLKCAALLIFLIPMVATHLMSNCLYNRADLKFLQFQTGANALLGITGLTGYLVLAVFVKRADNLARYYFGYTSITSVTMLLVFCLIVGAQLIFIDVDQITDIEANWAMYNVQNALEEETMPSQPTEVLAFAQTTLV